MLRSKDAPFFLSFYYIYRINLIFIPAFMKDLPATY